MTDGLRGEAVTPSFVWRETTLVWQKTEILTDRILIKLVQRRVESLAGSAYPIRHFQFHRCF